MLEQGDEGVDISTPRADTRWDDRSGAIGAMLPSDDERGGLYLAILAALLLPFLVVIAVIGALDDESAASETAESDTGLDELVLDGVDTTDPGAGATETASIDEPETAVAGASIENTTTTLVPGAAADEPDDSVALDATEDVATAPVTDAPETADPTDGTSTSQQPTTTDAPGTSTNSAPTTTTPTTTRPTAAPTTTITGTAQPSVTQPPVERPTTTTPTTRPTTTRPTTTTRPPTTTTSTTTTAPEEPAAFAQRIDIGELGDTFVRFRFMSEHTSGYTAIIRSGGSVVSRISGTALGGQLVDATFNGLLPGTDYTVQVFLDGPPPAVSPLVSFRTSGSAAQATEPVEVLNLRVADIGETRIQVNYESNICANGSFTITDPEGRRVGSNSGQANGCTTRHLAIPGFWTPALTPGTTYTITVTVEADGRGRGNGNTASASVTVTTSG